MIKKILMVLPFVPLALAISIGILVLSYLLVPIIVVTIVGFIIYAIKEGIDLSNSES